MLRVICLVLLAIGTGVSTAAAESVANVPAPQTQPAPRTREFTLDYGATIRGLAAGSRVRVWLPVPASSEDQEIRLVRRDAPAAVSIAAERKYGNTIAYFETVAAPDGAVRFAMTYHVLRREAAAEPLRNAHLTADLFLRPDTLVPIGGKPITLLAGKALPEDAMSLGRVLYDTVDDHMQYRKDKPGYGRGDAVWACDSRFGNCTDFHSLFISLARTERLPALFEIGLPLPESRGRGEISAYHCWSKFRLPDGRWIPVDISEANKHPNLREYYYGHLTPDRVAMSVGRDLTLVPPQEGPPLNYFVYPYVEVDGKPLPPEQIEKTITFADID